MNAQQHINTLDIEVIEGDKVVATTSISWPINYHSPDIEEDVLHQSDVIIDAALAKLPGEEEIRNKQGIKFNIFIRRDAWGTLLTNRYNIQQTQIR